MEEKNLLQSNLEYFNNELLPYYIILHTAKGAIVVDVKEENLKHLVGATHSTLAMNRMRPIDFYTGLTNKELTLFSLIDEERFNNEELLYEETLIYNKNYYFQTAFDTLIQSPSIYLYRKASNNDLFDTDYLHFKYENGAGVYIGIVGDTDSDYHHFNSILAELDKPEKYRTGGKIKITNIERIKKELFKEDKYKFSPSKRFQTHASSQKQTKSRNFKKIKNEINKLLPDHIKITVGSYGNNSVQIFIDGNCTETKASIPNQYNTAKEIANFIKDNYS